MLSLLRLLFGLILCLFGSRGHLILENIALCQQVTALRRRRQRPRLTQLDRLFWVTLRSRWSNWKDSLIIVTPDTVVRWHRAGFRLYWKWISKPNRVLGRKPITRELRRLVFQMAAENPSWGAPRIHGELLKLGFDISEGTVSRLLRRVARKPEAALHWKTFLQNHRETIAAMDFFTVPTLTFGILYCFFVIDHDRRRILHFNVRGTLPTVESASRLRDALPIQRRLQVPHFQSRFEVRRASVQQCDNNRTRTPPDFIPQSLAEWRRRAMGRKLSARLVDHIVPINEPHFKRLLSEYLAYYHSDRTHLGLEKDTPFGRPTVSAKESEIVSSPQSRRLASSP
jgi:putative transposase